ncbi:uncharacterized protein LOC110266734 [Arachis ipaensis]|uniref:uncharacterized protein LOC110266733 n=1 Tax=Arachis ipaensis TaxID=130454 RepID=UPI000A2AF710|nr:uncharacterized protein LOC110266733 [Arachis ipaensis]XP_020967369.1 uncharacterized protein LOC110266734 [Arachis ipaensis]
MNQSNPMPTPMVSSLRLHKNDSEIFDDPKKYRSIVGALQFLTITRPDIAFAVNKCSQFMHQPTIEQWKAVKRILRYLQDWATDLDDRRSISGYLVFLGSNLIAWKCEKQSEVSRSSTKAEYRAVASAQTEVMSIQQFLQESQVSQQVTPMIYCDNQSTCHLAVNPVMHSCCKHLETDLHFLRELVNRK